LGLRGMGCNLLRTGSQACTVLIRMMWQLSHDANHSHVIYSARCVVCCVGCRWRTWGRGWRCARACPGGASSRPLRCRRHVLPWSDMAAAASRWVATSQWSVLWVLSGAVPCLSIGGMHSMLRLHASSPCNLATAGSCKLHTLHLQVAAPPLNMMYAASWTFSHGCSCLHPCRCGPRGGPP
jgi:hypothetical protein